MKEFIRTFFISFEFVTILFSIFVYILFGEVLENLLKTIALNEDMLKYILPIPVAIFCWIFKDGGKFLLRDTEYAKILVHLEEYKKLKICFYVGFIYAVSSLIICIISAVTYQKTALHTIAFCCGVLVLSIVAISFYLAHGEIKDIFVKSSS